MPIEDFVAEHRQGFDEASSIYIKRSKTRGQLWLEKPIAQSLMMASEKVERAREALRDLDDDELMEEFIDSCIDGMNELNFALKKARRGIRA